MPFSTLIHDASPSKQSKSRSKVVGREVKPHSSGKSAFRFLVPRQAVLDDPETERFAKINGQLIIWYGPDRRVVMYPCEDNKQFNFVCIHPREESDPGSVEGRFAASWMAICG